MRLVDELLVAAADKREAVPEEALRLAAVVRRRKLPVGVIRIGVCLVLLGHRHHLVEIAVGVSLGALLDETASGVVGVASGHAVGRGRDELVRVIEREGGSDVRTLPSAIHQVPCALPQNRLFRHVVRQALLLSIYPTVFKFTSTRRCRVIKLSMFIQQKPLFTIIRRQP